MDIEPAVSQPLGSRLKGIVLAPSRLLERSRGIGRGLLISLYLLVGLAVVTLTYRQTRLISLPDVGEPFDVPAFLAFTLADDQNALLPYREAVKLYKPPTDPNLLSPFPRIATPPGPSSPSLSAEARSWVEANRPALEQFRQAWDRPDAFDPAGRSVNPPGRFEPEENYHRLCGLALLEAQRLVEDGDLAGAWTWYRSLMRSSWLIGHHSGESARAMGRNTRGRLARRLTVWAEHPKTDLALLRRALADVQACEPLLPSEAEILKVAYIVGLDNFGAFFRASAAVDIPPIEGDGFQPPRGLVTQFYEAKRWIRRDNERSRRVLNLVFCNWLKNVELPLDERPDPVIRVKSGPRLLGLPADFYPFPAAVTKLDPIALARWYASTIDLRTNLPPLSSYQADLRQDLVAHGSLVLAVANEIYRQEHGTLPESPEKLVGAVLDHLPENGAKLSWFGDVPMLQEQDPTELDQD